jgi:hypothetical protein
MWAPTADGDESVTVSAPLAVTVPPAALVTG